MLGKPLTPHTEDEEFDPEGTGYDQKAAEQCGLSPDDTGHWPNRCPHTGQLLKGRAHLTWDLLEEGEKKSGFEIFKGSGGKYYSKPKSYSSSEKKRKKKK